VGRRRQFPLPLSAQVGGKGKGGKGGKADLVGAGIFHTTFNSSALSRRRKGRKKGATDRYSALPKKGKKDRREKKRKSERASHRHLDTLCLFRSFLVSLKERGEGKEEPSLERKKKGRAGEDQRSAILSYSPWWKKRKGKKMKRIVFPRRWTARRPLHVQGLPHEKEREKKTSGKRGRTS